MNFGKHVKRKNARRYSVSVVASLLLTCLVCVAAGAGLANLRFEESAHAMSPSETSGTAASNNASGNANQQNATPVSLQAVQDAISAADGSPAITTQGFTLSAESQAAVQAQLANFANGGYTTSFMLADIATGRTIEYNADTQIYSASSAKAPYLMSLFSTGTVDLNAVYQASDPQAAAIQQKVDVVLRDSDNDAYDWFYQTYGLDLFNTWAEQQGVSSRMTPERGGYMFTSARDMAKLWTAGYGFLFAGQTSGAQGVAPESLQWLAGEMTDSRNSNIHAALGDTNTVYTKAGWIAGEGGYYSLNDAGIVASQSGAYVLAVLTDACDRNDLLTGLIGALDAVHSGDMQG